MQKVAAILLSLALITGQVQAEPKKIKCQQGVVMELWLMSISAMALVYIFKYAKVKKELEELKAKTATPDCSI